MAIIPSLACVAVFAPQAVELPPCPAVIAGYGQPEPPTLVVAGTVVQAKPVKAPELPPAPSVLRGFGVAPPPDVSPAGALLCSPFAQRPTFPGLPECPAVIAGYGQASVPEQAPTASVLRAPRIELTRLPPRSAVLTGWYLVDTVPAPIPLGPVQAKQLPTAAPVAPRPSLLAGFAPPVPTPLRPIAGTTLPPGAALPPRPEWPAGVVPFVPIPLVPVLATTLPPLASLPPQARIIVGFGEAEPPDAIFHAGGPGRVERGTYRHRTAYGIDNGMLSPKDPNTEEHFERDCTRILQTHAGGTIASIVSAVFEEGDDACVVLEGPAISEDGLKWSIKLGGGTSGVFYRYRVRFLTTAGETLDASIEFYCTDPVH